MEEYAIVMVPTYVVIFQQQRRKKFWFCIILNSFTPIDHTEWFLLPN